MRLMSDQVTRGHHVSIASSKADISSPWCLATLRHFELRHRSKQLAVKLAICEIP
jgi:hypothetical protein